MLPRLCTCARTCSFTSSRVPPACTHPLIHCILSCTHPHIHCILSLQLAALKYAHKLDLEKRSQQHRELVQVVMHDKSTEGMLMVKQTQRDHDVIVQAVLDGWERKRAADEARHQQEMLDLRQQFVGQQSTQQVAPL